MVTIKKKKLNYNGKMKGLNTVCLKLEQLNSVTINSTLHSNDTATQSANICVLGHH